MTLNRWQSGDGLTCSDKGSFYCNPAFLLCGTISKFHTEELEKATRQINAILEQVPQHDDQTKLSILQTPHGLFLAWTQESDEGVTIDNEDEIKKFLGTYDCSSQEK
jgi:hypothetical protein